MSNPYENYSTAANAQMNFENQNTPERPVDPDEIRWRKKEKLEELSEELFDIVYLLDRHDPEFLDKNQIDELDLPAIIEMLEVAGHLASLMHDYEEMVKDE